MNAISNTVPSGNFTVAAGNILLPTTSSTVGQITINSVPYLHGYGTANIFAGGAGNLSLSTSNSVCIGSNAGHALTSGCADGILIGYNAGSTCTTTGANSIVIGSGAAPKVPGSSIIIGKAAYSGSGANGGASGSIGIGVESLKMGGSGSNYAVNNIAIGYRSGYSLDDQSDGNSAQYNVIIGYKGAYNMVRGAWNLCLGNCRDNPGNYYGAGSALGYGFGNILLANLGVANEANTIRIGNDNTDIVTAAAYIYGIYGSSAGATAKVAIIDSTSKFGGLAGTAGQVLQGGTTPVFSTATYPATVATGDILAATNTNVITVIAGTTATASYVLTGNGSGVLPSWQAAAVTAPWLTKTNASADGTAAVNTCYTINHATPANLLTLTLPATYAVGDRVEIVGNTAGLWKLVAASGDTIKLLGSTTSAGGYLLATTQYDCVEVVCTVANTTWVVCSCMGNLTIA